MSQKSNPTVIGAFVVGAIVLLATGTALFGGAEYFAQRQNYEAYFETDTKGLRIGSNVLLNGVRIGFVSDIALLMDEETFNTLTRVTLEILPDTFYITDSGQVVGTGARDDVPHEVLVNEAGLRAQLEMQSIVTGQLVVALHLKPETEAVMRGIEAVYPEIPTLPTNAQQIMEKVQNLMAQAGENLDLADISRRFNSILKGLDELANSPDLREGLAGLNRFMNDEDTQELTGSLRATVDKLKVAAEDASVLFRNADGQISSLAEEVKPAVARLADVMNEAEQTLAAAKEQLRGDSVQMYQLNLTLEEVQGAARSLRQFFDYLERNPEALLNGKNP